MRFTFTVEVEVNRVSGPFASRDDIESELQDVLEQADPGSLQPGDNEYEVLDWNVTPEEPAPRVRRKKATT